MTPYEIISLIISGLGLASIVFLCIQIYLSKKHSREMHEEQRRIQTLSVLNNFCKSTKKETRIAEKVVEKLSVEKCKNLYNYTPFDVPKSVYKNICQLCSEGTIDCQKCKPKDKSNYTVHGTQLTELRAYVTSYLNALEIVAVSWDEAIVDKEVIEKQFAYLDDPGTKTALENYRRAANNGRSFPALEKFYKKIQQNNKDSATPMKKPLGKKNRRKHK